MRLNYDLIRDIMLKVEFEANGTSNIDPQGFAEEYFSNYDSEVVLYHIKYLRNAKMIEPQTGYEFIDLTPKGHEFLNNIRDNKIWEKVKKKAYNCLESVSLSTLAEAAKRIIFSSLGL